MSPQHQPRRTCIGCRQTVDQDQLMRWVAIERGDRLVPVPDAGRRMSGRGAWLHPSPECASLALKRRAFARAFRSPVDTVGFDPAQAAAGGLPSGQPTDTTVQPESGSEN